MEEKSKTFDPEKLIAYSALILSLCAIVIAVYEVSILEEQKHAAVWPRLFIARNTGMDTHEVVIKNAGVGPAQILAVEVRVEGKPMRTWNEAVEAVTGEASFPMGKSTITNRVLPAGEDVYPLRMQGEVANMLNASRDQLTLKVCYCSIYDRCWVLDEGSETAGFATPKSTPRCERNEATQLRN